jgi:hypothetical protein
MSATYERLSNCWLLCSRGSWVRVHHLHHKPYFPSLDGLAAAREALDHKGARVPLCSTTPQLAHVATTRPSGPDLMVLNARFRRTLRAQNKSDRTVEAYTKAVRLPAEFCKANGHPLTVKALKRERVCRDHAGGSRLGRPGGHRPRQGPAASRACLRPQDSPRAGSLPACASRPSPRWPARPVDRPQRRHDPLGCVPRRRRPWRIGRPAGLASHQLRHSFAAAWLAAGGTEADLMRLAGWKSRTMVDRYAKATAEQRAEPHTPGWASATASRHPSDRGITRRWTSSE